MAMYNVPNNNDNYSAEKDLLKVLLNYKDSLDLFKRYYKRVYADGSRSNGQILVSPEIIKKCDSILNVIEGLLRVKRKLFLINIPSEILSGYYLNVELEVQNAINFIRNTTNGIIQQVPRPTDDNSNCEISKPSERKLNIRQVTINKLNCTALTINSIYSTFKNYGIII